MNRGAKHFKSKYPIEYIEAQLEFGIAVHKITNQNIFDVFCNYTDIYGTLSNNKHVTPDIPWIEEVLNKFNFYLLSFMDDVEKLVNLTYDLYLSIPQEEFNPFCEERLKFGCFKLNKSDFYLSRNEVRVHFSPLKLGQDALDPRFKVSDLSKVFLPMRKHEFSELVNYIYNNHDEFNNSEYLFSCTWLQNIPAYSNLFTNKSQRRIKTDEFYWFWTQFVKWDGTGNSERLHELKNNLRLATNLNDAVRSIPLPVIETRVKLSDLFFEYVEGYQNQEEFSSIGSESDTNPLLQQESDYQLAI